MALKPIQILINAKDNASGVFNSLQAKVAAVGAAIASYFGIQAFAGVIKGAADFEGAMSRVQAATGASGAELAALKQAAEDAGASTKYTSIEAAAALENLAKAGLEGKDAIAALPAVMNLAQAADIDLAQSAEFVTKAVMGMGLQFEDAGRVADVLAKGANATNTSVTGLAQALSYAAPVANSLGLSLEGTVAIIGKFADAGIDASRAGTALNSILSQFADPASKFRNELALAGITTGDFESALHQLAAAGPAGSKAIQAVGLEAGPALRALLGQGIGALDELKGKLQDSAGSAAETARVMQNNLNGAFTGLASAWDTVKNVLGTPVLPALKDGVDQLAGALRSAVADGTIQRFGESIATAFQNGLKWIKEFVGSIDFAALTAKLQGWADETAATFDKIGTYATNAGNIVKTAWGVMGAGVSVVLAGIYGLGKAFTETASTILRAGIAINEQLQKIAIGDAKERLARDIEQMRNILEGLGQAGDEYDKRMRQSMQGAAESAGMAREGFAGLAGTMQGTSEKSTATSAALDTVVQQLQKTAEANTAATAAQQKKAQADADAKAAAEAHAQAIATLREEYAAAVASGDWQKAAEKIQEINKALRDTASGGKDAAKAAQDTATQVAAAFERLGVTSSEALKRQAASSQRDYQTIRESGLATAQDLQNAFKKAADDAIAANKGIAPAWVQAEAAIRGYSIKVDEAGKATLELRNNTQSATDAAVQGHERAAGAVDRHRTALERLNSEKEREIAALEKANQLKERQADLERKRLGVDKEGFTADKNGQRQIQFAWTRTSIIDYLKQAGLDEMLAEDLSKQFTRPDGTVPYMVTDAQKKWGGKHSTLAGALGKMADYYKYGDGKHEAEQRTKFLRGQDAKQGGAGQDDRTPAPASRPAPTPPPAPSQSAGVMTSGARTVNLTVNLGNGRTLTGPINTDAQGADTLEQLLRELERGQLNAGR